MFYVEGVETKTFELLKNMMNDKNLEFLSLIGGTALTLHIGHRISEDLDLFTTDSFDVEEINLYLSQKYNFKTDFSTKQTLKGNINGVKIDCLKCNYPLIKGLLKTEDNIRLYSLEDISAMKLLAINDNGTRLKDFVDIACLSTKLSLNQMLEAYEKKFPNQNKNTAFKALTYHNDIDFDVTIDMIKGNYQWEKIEERIEDMVNNKTLTFDEMPIEKNRTLKR